MKYVVLLPICMLLFSCGVKKQPLNLNNPLPEDTRIKKGVLTNGMTYYLHSTDVAKDVASFYIIQNVGSILEDDDQRGLAHFLEHMAFNGTESFPGKGILDKMQEHGLAFGGDINAYTSFDETVYNIDNIPTTPELLDTGLQILHDWSNYLLLTDEEIDSERGVIKEEWRTRQNGRRRIREETSPTMFNNSKYSDRMPIGLMSVVDNFDYKALRDFYHDWYRTDLQAIAIVGDIDVDEMEQKINTKFSNIPTVDKPKERFVVRIPDNDRLMFAAGMDKEVATSSISFRIRHDKSVDDQNVADLQESLLNSIISSIFSERIRELALNPESSFNGASIGYGGSTRLHNVFFVGISPKPNMQQVAFKEVLTEVSRAVKFGFTDAEINRTKTKIENSYENRIATIDDASHRSIVDIMKSNYLENAHMTDIVKEFELVKALFSKMSSQEIHARLQEMYTEKNRSVIATSVEGNKNITKEEILSILNEVENDASIEAYVEETETRSLMDGVDLNAGTIISATLNEITGATVFELSNGITVNYKFVDKNKNNVRLAAISDGGKSLLADSDLASNEFLAEMVMMSGLGEFSMTDLSKLLVGKTAKSFATIGTITESVNGFSSTKDVETMLQLVNLRFTNPRFDENSYNVLMQNMDNYLIQNAVDLDSKMSDSITIALYGNNNPKKRLMTKEYVDESSFETIKSIYQSRFANAADFNFFIVGDVKQEELTPLLEKYIASIPTTSAEREKWVLNSAYWKLKKTDRDVYLEMEDPKASVNIAFKNDMEYSLKDAELLNVLGAILKLRFTETLREDEGGTYGASSRAYMVKEPEQLGNLSIRFDCNPDKVEDLIKIVYQELEAVKKGEINQIDLDKTLANLLKNRENLKNYNSYEMSLLVNYVLEGYDMNDPDNFENIINSITIKDIQDVTKRLLDDAKSFEIVFKPEIKE